MSDDAVPKVQRSAWKTLRKLINAGCATVLVFVLWQIFETPFRLIFGWLFYLCQVIPQTQSNWELISCSLAALLLGVVGLHWLMPRILPLQHWHWRWSFAWCALLIILFATSIAAVGIVHQTGWLFRTPHWIEDRSISSMMKSASNAKQVRVALSQYAAEHDGRLPDNIRELSPSVITDSRICFGQIEKDGPMEPWVYAGAGLTDTDFGDLPVLWSPRPNSRGDRIVARLDGSAQILTETDFQLALATLREHWAKTKTASHLQPR